MRKLTLFLFIITFAAAVKTIIPNYPSISLYFFRLNTKIMHGRTSIRVLSSILRVLFVNFRYPKHGKGPILTDLSAQQT